MTGTDSAPTISITLHLFAAIAERCGLASGTTRTIKLPASATVTDVWTALAEMHPDAADDLPQWRDRTAVAINERLARDESPVHDGDDVAFLPPVSGG